MLPGSLSFDSLIPTKEAKESKNAAEVGGEVTTGNSDINLTIHHSVLSKALGCEIPPATQPRLPFFGLADNSRITHSVLITIHKPHFTMLSCDMIR